MLHGAPGKFKLSADDGARPGAIVGILVQALTGLTYT
jgi:hypothetical protein